MNIDIRQSIINNFKNCNTKEIKESIESAIKDSDEITLPGIGVFFEILWKNSSEKDKNFLLEKIINGLK